jgi:hypothetical protein
MTIIVHPSTRQGFAAERLRKAAQIQQMSARHGFLGEALERYRAWAITLGVPPHMISKDVAILRGQFYPKRTAVTALPGMVINTAVES